MLERALIGTMYLHPEVVPTIAANSAWLSEPYNELFEWFVDQGHKKAGVKINRNVYPFDLGELDRCVEESDIDNLDAIIELLRDKYLIAASVHLAQKFIQDIGSTDEPQKLITEAQNTFTDLLASKEEIHETHASAFIDSTLELIAKAQQSAKENPTGVSGICTGNHEFNTYFGGWQPNDQVVIAARAGMGKTTFVIQRMIRALELNRTVVFFSLEMGKEQIMQKFASELTGIDTGKMLRGDITDNEYEEIIKAMDTIRDWPLFIEATRFSLRDIINRTRLLNAMFGVDLVTVDYMQLVDGGRTKGSSREQEVSFISRQLKILAKEISATLLPLSQLSRAVEQRSNKRPMLSDLRESGAIEQDADIVIFLYRPVYYGDVEDYEYDENSIEWIVAKNRTGGKLGTVLNGATGISFIEPKKLEEWHK